MKSLLFTALFMAVVVLTGLCYKQEVQLKDKFSEGYKYNAEIFYVETLLGQPRIELRNKTGSLLVEPVKINKAFKAADCEFFFSFDKIDNVLEVYVVTGGPQWSWSKRNKQDWVRNWEDFSWNGGLNK